LSSIIWLALMAHRDERRSDGQPSLSGHSGHEAIFGAQRSVPNDPQRNLFFSLKQFNVELSPDPC